MYRNILGDRGRYDDCRIYVELARRGILDDITQFDHEGNFMGKPKPNASAKRRVNKATRFALDMGLLEQFRPGCKDYKKMLYLTRDGLATMNHFYDVTASGVYSRQ